MIPGDEEFSLGGCPQTP